MATEVVIYPKWDEVRGYHVVEYASVKGLGGVQGLSREKFNEAVQKALPENTPVTIEFDDETVHLGPQPIAA